jgi:hypothetical protein
MLLSDQDSLRPLRSSISSGKLQTSLQEQHVNTKPSYSLNSWKQSSYSRYLGDGMRKTINFVEALLHITKSIVGSLLRRTIFSPVLRRQLVEGMARAMVRLLASYCRNFLVII